MRLILVSNRLPIQEDGSLNVGGLATGLSSFLTHWKALQNDIIWLGWPGKNIPEKEQKSFSERMMHDHNTVPVYLKQKLADSFTMGSAIKQFGLYFIILQLIVNIHIPHSNHIQKQT
jgi:trehalose 6-phosphate synthase/phosphatase